MTNFNLMFLVKMQEKWVNCSITNLHIDAIFIEQRYQIVDLILQFYFQSFIG